MIVSVFRGALEKKIQNFRIFLICPSEICLLIGGEDFGNKLFLKLKFFFFSHFSLSNLGNRMNQELNVYPNVTASCSRGKYMIN